MPGFQLLRAYRQAGCVAGRDFGAAPGFDGLVAYLYHPGGCIDHHHRQQVDLADKGGHELAGREVVNIERRSHLLHAPGAHHHHPVRQRQGFFLVVRDVDGGNTQLLLDAADLLAQLHPDLGIQRRERLIQQQHARPDGQRPRQRHTLLLPAGKLVGVAVAILIQVDQAEHLADALLDLGLGGLAHLQPKTDVLPHRQVGEQGIRLEHHAHVALVGRLVGNIFLVQRYPALRGQLKTGDHAQRGSFATARRAQEGNKFAFFHVQVEVFDNRGIAEPFIEVR